MKNLAWFLIPSLAISITVLADGPAIAKNSAIKASYDFNLNVEELNEAEARLKALEKSLASKLGSSSSNKTPEKKQLAVVETKSVAPAKTQMAELKKEEDKVEQVRDLKNESSKPTVQDLIATLKNEHLREIEGIRSDLLSEIATLKNEHSREIEGIRKDLLEQAEKETSQLKEENKAQADQIAQLTVANQAYKNIEKDLNVKFEAQVEKLGMKLMLAETEVERLAAMLEDQNRKALGLKPIVREALQEEVIESKKVEKVKETEQNVDMPVVKVAVDKANLRTGPGMNHSPLMEVAGGSRLVVEQKQGAWFRVLAPNGVRAWIAADVTEIVPNGFNEETTTVRVQGYDQNVEARALRLIKGNL